MYRFLVHALSRVVSPAIVVGLLPDKCPRTQSGHLESRICPLPGRVHESAVRVVPVPQHRDILVSMSRRRGNRDRPDVIDPKVGWR